MSVRLVSIHRQNRSSWSPGPPRSLAAAAGALIVLGLLAAPGAAVGQRQQTRATARDTVATPAARQVNTWTPTGAMSTARSGATATLLPDGEVLVAGGGTSSAELYDPSTGAFTATASMSAARTDATATLLHDGDVLVAGGCCQGKAQLNSAELYNPGTGTWTATGSMNIARSSHTATLLANGDVLVAGGGCNGHGFGCDSASYLGTLRSAELYDPDTGTWTRTGTMHQGREFFTASLLGNGDVLAAGGFDYCDDSFCTDLETAEVYDVGSGHWTTTGSMAKARERQTASVLADGRVLVAGGLFAPGGGAGSVRLTEAELYDPTTGSWSQTAPMATPHYDGTSTVLQSGLVLVAGGTTRASQLYDPGSGLWVSPGPMSTVRTGATATLLADGHVLVTGGSAPDGQPQLTAETFLAGKGPLVLLQPDLLRFGAKQVGSTSPERQIQVANLGTGPLRVTGVSLSGMDPADFAVRSTCDRPVPPGGNCLLKVTFTPLASGHRTATVGIDDNAPQSPQRADLSGYGNGPFVWAPAGPLAQARDNATATSLKDGTVLVAGGEDQPLNDLASAEVYNPSTRRFSPTGSLSDARAYATAVRLPDGRVLVAGGLGGASGSERLSSAELYDPSARSWTRTGAMLEAGYALTSTLLRDGRVLVAGFGPDPAELYDPTSGQWSDTAPTAGNNGAFAMANLLADGDVLLAGGGTAAAQLYDPATGTWTSTGSMTMARTRASATLLLDHRVLVAGGYDPNSGVPTASSELYDPSSGSWSRTVGSMNSPRSGHTAVLLPNGWVLVAGGCTASCNRDDVTNSVDEFDVPAGYWIRTTPMTQARFAATATLTRTGSVLIAGGSNYCCRFYSGAETYTMPFMRAVPGRGSVGTDVTLRGYGFYADEPVRITWDGKLLAKQNSDESGGFAYPFVVPDGAVPGRHHLLALGRTSHGRATATFVVTS